MKNNKLRIAGIVAIILGIIVTASGILVNISESNTIGFTEGLEEGDQIVIHDPDNSNNWVAIIDDEIVTTYTFTETTTPTETPTETTTTTPEIPEFDTINFDSLVFELIEETIIECRFGFRYNEHDIKEAQISFSKNGNQLLDGNNTPVILNCDKIGVRAFRTELDWWDYPDGKLDVDVTIKFDVFINGVQIPDLVDVIGFYDDKGSLTIPEHDDEKTELHVQQGLGKWLIIGGIFTAIIGLAMFPIARKLKG